MIAVTGAGAVSALGVGCEALWSAVASGEDGIRRIERFATGEFTVDLGAVVPGRNSPMAREELGGLCVEYAVLAAREALAQAGLDGAANVGLVLGTSLGDMNQLVHTVSEEVRERLELRGLCLTISTACASSANALGLGVDLLRDGTCDVVLAGGTDILSESVFAGFHALGVLNRAKCAPFGMPLGTTLGEGAGFVVLEREEAAAARGAAILAHVPGYGLSSDAYHATSPEPTGAGVARAIASALQHASVPADAVGYVNAHGSGTAANDRAEWQAIERVFGKRAAQLPVSSSKSFLGHAQGAAGVLELIITLLAQQRDLLPQTLHCEQRRPYAPPDPVAAPVPRPAHYDHAVCTSSAFGGANVALVLTAARARPSAVRSAPRRGAALLGFGVARPDSVAGGQVVGAGFGGAGLALADLVPTADPRELDDAALYLTAAAAAALRDAGVTLRGPARDRAGLIVGTTSISARAGAAFERSIAERGMARCSTTAFARLVLNAAAGSAAKLLSLRGPTSTVSIGPGSGLAGIIYAATLLDGRDDVEMMVAAGVDALATDDAPAAGDGAVCIVLGRSAPTGAGIAVGGYALGPPGSVAATAALALRRADLALDDVDLLLDPGSDRHSTATPLTRELEAFGPATRSAALVAWAAMTLRSGAARRALVVSAEGASATAALVLTAGDAT